ncbi:MAG: filamentous hemagglutinin N-terminal domain-containing protein, partial [Verrucomicrobiales bacterium]|nr:filamentous hemagglutinin N-terminal domain-containing protein [Verrucomicrobiales bacterium]
MYRFFLALMLPLGQALGQVVVDNSFGQAGPLDGPNFQIPAKLGKTVGGNLFHSFAEFSLTSDQSATFIGSDSINNILGRVTGDKASHIDGLLKSEIDGAGLFLMNPNGIVLGKNAKVDVSGSFVLTAQDRIKLGDSVVFTTKSDVSSFSQAAPDAFGFLGDNPAGKIEISAKNLELNVDGGMFGLVGKDVAFKKNANLELSGFDEVKIEADSVGMDFKSSLSVINSREEMPTDFALKANQFSMNRGLIGNASKRRGMPTGEIRITGLDGPADLIDIINQSRIVIKNKGGQAGDLVFEADRIEIKKNTKFDLKSSGAKGPSFIVNANSFKTVDSDVECLTTGREGVGGGIEIHADDIELSGYLRTRSGDNNITESWTGNAETHNMRMAAKGGDISLTSKSVVISKTSIPRPDPTDWITTNGMESSLSTIATTA